MSRLPLVLCLACAAQAAQAADTPAAAPTTTTTTARPHNAILFIADGLRSHIVDARTAPALAAVRAEGVDLADSHSVFPTVTTANASAIATGHQLGDTGDFGNAILARTGFDLAYPSPIVGLEDDVMLRLMNKRYNGDYLGQASLLQAARAHGFQTAAIGKLGPTAIQDVTALDGKGSILIDDATGSTEGPALDPDVAKAIKAAGLAEVAPDRGLNTWPGTYDMAGVRVANVDQQDWMTAVATKVLLPRFKAAGKPFVLVFWSRDPDITQHNQGDSLNTLTPGINGDTSMAAIANASKDLGALRAALKDLGLDATTDVVVAADHGFSTLSRRSATSWAAKRRYRDVVPGFLPPGFLAIDLAHALGLKLFDPTGLEIDVADGAHPRSGSAILADRPDAPQVVLAGNGGAVLIYLPGSDWAKLAPRIAKFLTTQDYTGALFARPDLGSVPGALSTNALMFAGAAHTPAPAIVVSFRSFAEGCADPEVCGVEVAESDLQQGQGIHGALSRQDTHNFMAAVGPDFKAGFVDPAPVGNTDIAPTLARALGFDLPEGGALTGRVLTEALVSDGTIPQSARHFMVSDPAANGFVTRLDLQTAGGETYLDAAGAPGRTIGLRP